MLLLPSYVSWLLFGMVGGGTEFAPCRRAGAMILSIFYFLGGIAVVGGAVLILINGTVYNLQRVRQYSNMVDTSRLA